MRSRSLAGTENSIDEIVIPMQAGLGIIVKSMHMQLQKQNPGWCCSACPFPLSALGSHHLHAAAASLERQKKAFVLCPERADPLVLQSFVWLLGGPSTSIMPPQQIVRRRSKPDETECGGFKSGALLGYRSNLIQPRLEISYEREHYTGMLLVLRWDLTQTCQVGQREPFDFTGAAHHV
jgi:hypothetical protein